jgi:hypothetical protein
VVRLTASTRRGELEGGNSGRSGNQNGENEITGAIDEGVAQIEEDESGQWYLGKAREEFQRRRRNGWNPVQPNQGEEDPIEVSCGFAPPQAGPSVS